MTEQILEALEIGLDCAIAEANDVHTRLAGYKPEKHAHADENVRKIEAAIALYKSQMPP
jgi:hypothetical protein